MSLFAKAKKARENKKGFTLVELIVVLVILAILAAILVPALLGWIDEARKKQYVLEARSVYMAAQAVADEEYAKGSIKDSGAIKSLGDLLVGTESTTTNGTGDRIKRIQTLADITELEILGVGTGTDAHGKYEVLKMKIRFKSGNGNDYVGATLENGTWTVNAGSTKTAVVVPETESEAAGSSAG